MNECKESLGVRFFPLLHKVDRVLTCSCSSLALHRVSRSSSNRNWSMKVNKTAAMHTSPPPLASSLWQNWPGPYRGQHPPQRWQYHGQYICSVWYWYGSPLNINNSDEGERWEAISVQYPSLAPMSKIRLIDKTPIWFISCVLQSLPVLTLYQFNCDNMITNYSLHIFQPPYSSQSFFHTSSQI